MCINCASMIITLDSISNHTNIAKIANQLIFLFDTLGIKCQTIADKHLLSPQQLEKQLLTYKKNYIFLLLVLENKPDIKSEMMINSHLVCSFIDNFISDLEEIAISENEKFDVIRPGNYSAYIWEQKKLRAEYTKHSFNWKIYKNYSAVFKDGIKINSEIILRKIARKIGSKVEQGITNINSIDKTNLFSARDLTINQIVAKQEIISLAKSFDFSLINSKIESGIIG